jgi:CHAT domain/VHL beta domain
VSVIEVAIEPGRSGTFKVEVVNSPAGEASATVKLDVVSLLAHRPLLQQALLASAVPARGVLQGSEQSLREIGQLLFIALLGTGAVAEQYRASAAVAADRGEALEVVLRIDTPALAALPWEAMYDQANGAYVCRLNQLVRHIPVPSAPAPLRVQPPLRILGVVSSPRGLPPLDVDKERDQLMRALARPISQGLAEVSWPSSPTWADLQDLLQGGVWHVVHFIGHGDYDPHQAEGLLFLTREDGGADPVKARRFIDLLRQARPMPRLIVLNSCSGAETGVNDLFSSTATTLIQGGVSAVAAMQYAISDPAAVAFARGFYFAIAHGRGVDDAVSSGRVAILGTSDATLEWVTPVLYLRGQETHLFTLPSGSEAGRTRDDAERKVQEGNRQPASVPRAGKDEQSDSSTWPELEALPISAEPTLRSHNDRQGTKVEFVNARAKDVAIYWLDYQGRRVVYKRLPAGVSYVQPTYVTHPWVITTTDGQALMIIQPTPEPSRITIR